MNIMFITSSCWQSPIVEVDPDSETMSFKLTEAQRTDMARSVSSANSSCKPHFVNADRLNFRFKPKPGGLEGFAPKYSL